MKNYPEFFRCYQCNRALIWELVADGNFCPCGCNRIRPTSALAWWEEILIVFRHPSTLKFVFRSRPDVA